MSRSIDPHGYVRLIGKQYHPRGWIAEHRWVVEQALGRRLTSNEVVHHINHIKHDNRLENLELHSPGSHISLHNHLSWPRKANGRWAEWHDACVECGLTERLHAAEGRCYRCYDRDYQKALRARQGAVPSETRKTAWSVSQDGTVYHACGDCGRSDVRPGARGLCQACVRWRKHHDGQPRTKPPRPLGSRARK